MSGFSELIKSFDKTRDYVRDFFIYGFKVRSEFNRKSSRTYDDEKRRVESWLGDFLRYDVTDRGKQVSISVDSGHVSENPLYRAFYSKSFTDNDIRLHFLLCDILSDGEALSVKEIADRLSEVYGAFFDEQTIRHKLKEYSAEGIFICRRMGRTDIFSLSSDTPESFFGEYKGLDNAVKFFSEASEFGIIGNSILKIAGMKNDIFLIKHNYIVHTLEDEILLTLTNAIEEESFVQLINFGKKGISSENYGVPLKIYISSQTGRRYLIMYLPKLKRISSFRLDFIKSVKSCGKCPEYGKYAEMLRNNCGKCFGVSFGDRSRGRRTDGIRITFYINEETEKYVVERLYREKRCGTIEHTGKNLYVWSADVFDRNEPMHWVKSYIGRIVSIEGAGRQLTEQFYNDISRMFRIYSKDISGGKEALTE